MHVGFGFLFHFFLVVVVCEPCPLTTTSEVCLDWRVLGLELGLGCLLVVELSQSPFESIP